LNISNLDFDTIKASLRDFLRSQEQFKDYDFEGAGLSVLLDILSYNTHYFSFYMNMIGNEMFLDSANLRSSVVSLAKHLNYTPRSITSSQARVSIVITSNNSNAAAVIEKNTTFTANVDGGTYTFITDRAYGATIDPDNKFRFPDVTLVEGIPYTYRIRVDKSLPSQRFVLPNASIDTRALTVRVQRSSTDTTLDSYVLASNLLELKSDTKAYFLQEVEDQKYEITFGDGIIGNALVDGNIVIVDYVLSKGPVANGAASFMPAAPLAGYPANLTTVTTLVPAAGGLYGETTDQIRFAAPKNYEAQGRAVTVSDYKLLITQDYTNVDSVAVWGGEDSVPPQYGKVFISIKPVKGFVITENAKALVVENIVRKRNVVSVIPEFIDPDYTFITVNCRVRYNPSNTFKTDGDIQTGAYSAIITYSTLELDKFDRELRYSRLLTAIDNSDASITNNLTTIQMKKTFKPRYDVATNYDFDFHNPVLEGSVSSSTCVVVHDPLLLSPYTDGKTYTILDDRLGNLLLYEHGIGIPDVSVRKVGTINYTTGQVHLDQFMPYVGDETNTVSLIMTPKENDVLPLRNNILFIKPEDVSVVAIPVASVQG
jgi:hypothetical protein